MTRTRTACNVPGKLRWQVDVADAHLERPDSTAFSTTYTIDDALVGGERDPIFSRNRTDYMWPTTDIDHMLIWDVARFAPNMLWLLDDRHHLGLVLLGGDDSPVSSSIARDGITARRWSGGAASLVHAVILARHMNDPELEALAFAKLDRLRDQEFHGWNFAESVGSWAREASASSPVDIADLASLARAKRLHR